MSRPSLLRLAMMEGLRRAQRRVRSSPLYSWRPSGPVPANLTTTPPTFKEANPAEATAIYAGRFSFDGETHTTPLGQTFARQRHLPASDNWRQKLHSFEWLRHLAAAQTPVAKANATALILDWIEAWETTFSPIVWRGDVAAARLVAWLRYGDGLIVNADPNSTGRENQTNRWRLRKSMLRHVRFLTHNAATTRDGTPKLMARIGLATALACLGQRERALQRACDVLDAEMRHQVLPDGGHVSRNPGALVPILDALLTLRDTLQSAGHKPSVTLVSTISRINTALHFFRIGPLKDGYGLAQFNGTGRVDTTWVSALLRSEGPIKDREAALPQSGYDRLDGGRTRVIMDTGRCTRPAYAPHATAGTLSFQLASQNTVFITNCGMPDRSMARYDTYARATAAHSTAVLFEESSSQFHENGLWAGRVLAAMPGFLAEPPQNVRRDRRNLEDKSTCVTASHDGYKNRFGIRHERKLTLSSTGDALDGSDRFPREGRKDEDCPVTIRFHIPPQIQVSALSSGHSILLAGPGGEAWTFMCIDAPFALEESILFNENPPRKCHQIAISTTIPKGESAIEVRWALRRKSSSKTRRKKSESATKEDRNKQDLFAVMDETITNDGEG